MPKSRTASQSAKTNRTSLVVTLIAAAVVVLADLAAILFYLPAVFRRGLPLHLLVVCILALIIYGVGRVISGAVLRERGATGLPPTSGISPSVRTFKFILLAILAACLELVLIARLTASGRSSILFNLLFYLVFFACGVILARDFDAETAPVLFGLVVTVVLAAAEFTLFEVNPATLARFGVDRTLIGLRAFFIRADALPMTIAITWAAWRVARVNKIAPSQAPSR